MKLPNPKLIQELQVEMDVLPGILSHCQAVARHAVVIAKKIKTQNPNLSLDVELIKVGAELHDLCKVLTLKELNPEKFGFAPASESQITKWQQLRAKYPKSGHELQILAEIMRQKGYDEFAKFLLQIGWTGNQSYLNSGLEIKIIHYADWTIQGDQIVPFMDRVDYCIERYGSRWTDRDQVWWGKYRQNELKLEKEITELLGV